MGIFDQVLKDKIDESGTSLCAGIDPHTGDLPAFMSKVLARSPEEFLTEISRSIIDVVAGKLPAVKFQSSFFEAHGAVGFAVLEQMIGYAKSKGLVTILDAKRGDISSTMEAYGKMAFDVMNSDILTVTPYMGVGAIQPLIPWLKEGRGIYMVWVSSNPGGEVVQDLASEAIFDAAVDLLDREKVAHSMGLVVGATKIEAMNDLLFDKSKSYPLLMPGVGAQGGVIEGRAQKSIDAKIGTLIPLSRALAGVGMADQRPALANQSSWQDYGSYLSNNLSQLLNDFSA